LLHCGTKNPCHGRSFCFCRGYTEKCLILKTGQTCRKAEAQSHPPKGRSKRVTWQRNHQEINMARIVSLRPFMKADPARNLSQSFPPCRRAPHPAAGLRPDATENTPSLVQGFSAEALHG
jgi:hypothetical protein